jgi:uncharacterized DUF497 family protein
MFIEFEFDLHKSEVNKQKHGIDFVEIQKLWDDPDRVEIQARTEDETRFLIIGRIQNINWSVIITYRAETIRIISARRSRDKEVKIYES